MKHLITMDFSNFSSKMMLVPPIHIQSVFYNSDITAVNIFDNSIFIAIGRDLYIFELSSFQYMGQIKALLHSRIHGIKWDEKTEIIICFGGREVAILNRSWQSTVLGCPTFRTIRNIDIGDWVWDVKLCDQELIVLTANNTATLCKWDTSNIMKRVQNEDRCLLYCGLIVGDTWDTSIIIGGSMFKSILIWAPSLGEGMSVPSFHKLLLHDGAVFSVYYNSTLSQLASTSDDRSVRIWNVKLSKNCSTIIESWKKADIVLHLTVYGHMSRVWKSIIVDDGRFISAGEDSQLRVWDANGNAICAWETHQGASIRSLALYAPPNEPYWMIFTGGKDGSVQSSSLTNIHNKQQENIEEIKFSSAFKIQRVQDVPRKILLSSSNTWLTVTNSGVLFIYDKPAWRTLFTDSRFSSYCLFQISSDQKYLALASIHGDIVILKQNKQRDYEVTFDKKVGVGKIFSFHWLNNNGFIICLENGHLNVWLNTTLSSQEIIWRQVCSFVLPKCKERWITAVICIQKSFIVGDRNGSMHLFHIDAVNPIQSFNQIHGKLGVSFLNLHSASKTISSIGRDGFIRYWKANECSLIHTSAERLPVRWPVRIAILNNSQTLVMGFKEVNFEVWLLGESKKLYSFKCGGGHRPWDFCINETNKHAKFVYIKGSSLYCVTSFNFNNSVTLIHGLHTRDINSLLFLTEDIFLSGSEDTTLRVCQLLNFGFEQKISIRSHISSIKAIDLCSIDGSHFVVSAGGRCEMKLWIIILKNGTVDITEIFSMGSQKTEKYRESDLEPRYMDAKLRLVKNHLYIYLAKSNSIWSLSLYNTKTKNMTLGREILYSSHCILKIFPLVCPENEEMVVTLATDGKACFWCHETKKLIHQKRIHQSGINSYDYVFLKGNVLLLVTGGDDTAVIASSFQISKGNVINLVCDVGIVHEAQVSAVKIFENSVFSSSGDQKFVEWTWEKRLDGNIKLHLRSLYRTQVPDTHGIDVFPINGGSTLRVCVYGAGFEILKIVRQAYF